MQLHPVTEKCYMEPNENNRSVAKFVLNVVVQKRSLVIKSTRAKSIYFTNLMPIELLNVIRFCAGVEILAYGEDGGTEEKFPKKHWQLRISWKVLFKWKKYLNFNQKDLTDVIEM